MASAILFTYEIHMTNVAPSDSWGEFSFDSAMSEVIILKAEATYFQHLMTAAGEPLKALEAQFSTANKQDQDYLSYLADGAHELDHLAIATADLCMVALYHWAERHMKRELEYAESIASAPATLAVSSGSPAATIASPPASPAAPRPVHRLDCGQIIKRLASQSIDISQLPAGPLVTGSLRAFANSWKHNGESVSTELATATVGLAPGDPGHLAEIPVRDAVGGVVGLAPGCSADDVVRSYAGMTLEFLTALKHAKRASR